MLSLNPSWKAFDYGTTHFWAHYGLCTFGFLLAVITYVTQAAKPAPYGKHQTTNHSFGPLVHQRLAHTVSDAIPGIFLFSLVFFHYGIRKETTNLLFYCMWLSHYLHRGIIHPWIMRYSSPKTPVGISLGALFPNLLYGFLNADWIGTADYGLYYYKDPCFVMGVMFFVAGYFINRYADLLLRRLRAEDSSKYYVPHGFLFDLISCPNYFGEMLEWFGWALATWSVAGVVWLLFSSATFIPRARDNHEWYTKKFADYPKNRKALIPFLY